MNRINCKVIFNVLSKFVLYYSCQVEATKQSEKMHKPLESKQQTRQ